MNHEFKFDLQLTIILIIFLINYLLYREKCSSHVFGARVTSSNLFFNLLQ